MAAQMEVNEKSDNTALGNTAGDIPNDGTGKLLALQLDRNDALTNVVLQAS